MLRLEKKAQFRGLCEAEVSEEWGMLAKEGVRSTLVDCCRALVLPCEGVLLLLPVGMWIPSVEKCGKNCGVFWTESFQLRTATGVVDPDRGLKNKTKDFLGLESIGGVLWNRFRLEKLELLMRAI